MKSRKAAADYANKLMNGKIDPPICLSHFGKTHLRMLMDFIYDGKPTRKDQFIKGDNR